MTMTPRAATAAIANGLAIFLAGWAGGLAVFALAVKYVLGADWSAPGAWALLLGAIASALWLARRAAQPVGPALLTLTLSNALIFVLLSGMMLVAYMFQRMESVRLPHFAALALVAALFWILRRAFLRQAEVTRQAGAVRRSESRA